MEQKELNKMVINHFLWLKGKGGKRLSLGGADLRGLDLNFVKLGGANLHRVDLRNVHIQGADLSDADLGGANLYGAHLHGTDLRCANMVGTELGSADLGFADLRGADLHGAHLKRTKLSGASLSGAKLDSQYVQVSRIGSRKGTTTYCVTDNVVFCGCWRNGRGGTLEEFEEIVEGVYGAAGYTPDPVYYREYRAAIAFFKVIRG